MTADRETMRQALADALWIYETGEQPQDDDGMFRFGHEAARLLAAIEPLIAEREREAFREGFRQGRSRAAGFSCACRLDEAGNEIEAVCEAHAERERAARREERERCAQLAEGYAEQQGWDADAEVRGGKVATAIRALNDG